MLQASGLQSDRRLSSASLTSLAVGLGMAGWEGPLVSSRWLGATSIPCPDGPLKAENDPLAWMEDRMHRHSAVQSPTGRKMHRITVEVLIGRFARHGRWAVDGTSGEKEEKGEGAEKVTCMVLPRFQKPRRILRSELAKAQALTGEESRRLWTTLC